MHTTAVQPVSGAEVSWIALEMEDVGSSPAWPLAGWGIPERRAIHVITGADGRFEFASPPAEDLPFGSVLSVLHPQHLPGGLDLPVDRKDWPAEPTIVLDASAPIEVEVVDSLGTGQAGAIVHHVIGHGAPDAGVPVYRKFLSQRATTDERGRVSLVPFPGQQTLWAEKDQLVSAPWQGEHPGKVRLVLQDSFTIGGMVTLPDCTGWDAEEPGERGIRIWGQEGSLWRPLVHMRDVQSGQWGPELVPLGRFARYRVRLEGAPIVPQEQEFERPGVGSHRRVDFTAEKRADLTIFVRDESGRPVPDARAVVWWGTTDLPTGPNRVEGTARPDGRIHLGTFPPGSVQFRVTAPGYALNEAGAQAPGKVTATLRKGGRIAGRCVSGGKPVPDFQVIYWYDVNARRYRTQSFFDREDGTFEIDGLIPGSWSIHAASESYPAGKPLTVEVAADGETRVELVLPGAIPGGGRVVDGQSGDFLPGARVQAFSSGGMEKSFPWGQPVVAGQDGTFELDAFVLGANYLTVEAEGFAVSDVTKTATTEEFLDWGDIRLFRPQALQVSLLGLEDLEVQEGWDPGDLRASGFEGPFLEEKTFDEEGTVTYEGVPPGDHLVFVSFPNDDWTRLHLQLEPGKDWRFDLKVAGSHEIDVNVVDETGKAPSPHLAVLFSAQEDTGTFVVHGRETNDEGHAFVRGIRASRGQVWVLDRTGQMLTSQDVTFDPSSTTQVVVELGKKPFRVHVLDADGNPLPGAWITIRSASGAEIHGVDDTDSDGWAELRGLPDGSLLMDVSHGIAGKRLGVAIDTAAGELEFVLEARGSLELKLVDGEEPLAGVATRIETTGGVTLSDVKQTDEGGVVRFEPLGEGSYHLACRRADCWPAVVDRSLGPDEHALLTVQMRRLGDLELTVVTPDGLPVSGLDVELRSNEFSTSVDVWVREERLSAPAGLTTNIHGQIHVQGLPRGDYSWSLPGAREAPGGSFTLSPARTNEVRVIVR